MRTSSTAAPPRSSDPRLAALRVTLTRMGMDHILDGSWFRKLTVEHIRRHTRRIDGRHWDQTLPGKDDERRAGVVIARACRRASVAGACASAGASTGEILSIFTEGLGAPIGLPAAVLSMCTEAAYTALLQVNLACDLASIYGVPFDVDDVGDVTTLFGLALGLPAKDPAAAAEDRPVGLTERLLSLEDGEAARAIGRKLLEDALLRNVVPIAGIAISARWNYVATRRLAQAVRRHLRYRRALRRALAHLELDRLAAPELLVEGAWLLGTVDGDASHDTALALGVIMDGLPAAARAKVEADRAFGDDEEGWFAALAGVPAPMHAPLLDVLCLVAAADRAFQPAERRFLHRVGRTLKLEVDPDRVDRICGHLARGEAPPADLLHRDRIPAGAPKSR
jgi:hypothetical protein